MAGGDRTVPTRYELPLSSVISAAPGLSPEAGRASSRSLPKLILTTNARWFCGLRWLVILMLAGFGLLEFSGDLASRLGLRAPGHWPLIGAAVLIVANVGFLLHARVSRLRAGARSVTRDLWGQIVLDLIVLTVVVHFVGSAETAVAYTYLFHIVLACVFFSRRQSLLVMALAITLYGACLLVEQVGPIGPESIFSDNLGMARPRPARLAILSFVSALGIWLVVWYLTARLSVLVRRRDIKLAEANARLEAALEERARHMLVTTHELKAPFAAIHANAQLLRDGYCGELSKEALEVAGRITARCRRLTAAIQEMLQLANLTSVSQSAPRWIALDAAEIVRWCLTQVEALAQERQVTFDVECESVIVRGVDDHLKMLFVNLLANAVIYSHCGGHVTVRCGRGAGGEAVVTISDRGIGIAPEKLPRIFEEHYRANEAVQHNKESSGLGLAIVRQVAEMHRIRLRVDSLVGDGTTFELTFPVPPAPTDAATA